MKKSIWIVVAIAAVLVLGGLLFQRNKRIIPSDDEERESEEAKGYSYPAPPEAPAPLQAAGQTQTYNFDSDNPGAMPAGSHGARTGQGSEEKWVVMAHSTASSKPNVVAQTSGPHRLSFSVADC